jgi:hypothetical protein
MADDERIASHGGVFWRLWLVKRSIINLEKEKKRKRGVPLSCCFLWAPAHRSVCALV